MAREVTKKRKDLKNIFYLGSNKDLNYIKNKNNNLHIGSATPINDILPILENIYPTFAKMFERYGSEQIRNTASLGGNIGSASPIGDSLPVLIALNSKILIQGKVKKTLLLDNYFLSYRKTKLKPNEIIKEIIIPIYKKNILKCYKISKRIDLMFKQNCIAEVKKFNLLKINKSLSANKLIGVQEINRYLNGSISLDAVSYTHLTLPTNREV